MKRITTSVALAITLSMTAAASAEDCDLQRAHWVCVPNQEPGAIQQFLDRFHQTMDRVLTPPGGWRQDTAVPPESVPQELRVWRRRNSGGRRSSPRRNGSVRLTQMIPFATSKIRDRAARRRHGEHCGIPFG